MTNKFDHSNSFFQIPSWNGELCIFLCTVLSLNFSLILFPMKFIGIEHVIVPIRVQCFFSETQVMNDYEGRPSVVKTTRRLLEEDGWKGFYRGFGPRFLNMSLWGTSMIVTYELISESSYSSSTLLRFSYSNNFRCETLQVFLNYRSCILKILFYVRAAVCEARVNYLNWLK